MNESFDTLHGALLGPDQDLVRSLSWLDVADSKLLRQHPETGCGYLKGRPALSSLTSSAHPDHSSPRQKAIQYP